MLQPFAAMEDLIPIGQFAAASRLSPKALRLKVEQMFDVKVKRVEEQPT